MPKEINYLENVGGMPQGYRVKGGRGFWEPTFKLRGLGAVGVPCGADGPAARAIAESMNAKFAGVKDHQRKAITADEAKTVHELVQALRHSPAWGRLSGRAREEYEPALVAIRRDSMWANAPKSEIADALEVHVKSGPRQKRVKSALLSLLNNQTPRAMFHTSSKRLGLALSRLDEPATLRSA